MYAAVKETILKHMYCAYVHAILNKWNFQSSCYTVLIQNPGIYFNKETSELLHINFCRHFIICGSLVIYSLPTVNPIGNWNISKKMALYK